MDIRVIAATNVDPVEAVQQGKLREDLYYRLNVFAIRLPPLRDRKDDIPLLAHAFIKRVQHAEQPRRSPASPTRRMRLLERYDWPGNVRELRNVIERATIVAKGRAASSRRICRRSPVRHSPSAPRRAPAWRRARPSTRPSAS